MKIIFEPLTPKTIPTYIAVGIQSYREHYLHLWKNQDATAFFEENLTNKAVREGLKNQKQFFYIIRSKKEPLGILKLTLDARYEENIPEKSILLNKIYLLRAFSGKGLGEQCLHFIEEFANQHHRKFIWLYTMKKGKAKNFYQKNGYKIIEESNVDLAGVLAEEKEMWVMGKPI